MQAIVGTFKQFQQHNSLNNGFKSSNPSFQPKKTQKIPCTPFNDKSFIPTRRSRLCIPPAILHQRGDAKYSIDTRHQNSRATICYPSSQVMKPQDINISAFDCTNSWYQSPFQMLLRPLASRIHNRADWCGKSGLLELLRQRHIPQIQGYALSSTARRLYINNICFIPASRIKDVVYFNPVDTAHLLGLTH